MSRQRSTPDELADKKQSLLAIIEAAAKNGHVCPSLGQLATLLRLSTNTVHELLNSLRNDRAISWSIVFGFGGVGQRVRVVTIKATGMQTALPSPHNKKGGRPAKVAGPTYTGPAVRDLRQSDPITFEFWKRHYEARDRAERARAQA